MIIHCTKYADVLTDFWMVVTMTGTNEEGRPEEHHGVVFCISLPSGHIRQNEEVYVEHLPRDEWRHVPDNVVPDFVWKAYGEWMLAGAKNA
jgi:hypothetical protein